MDKLENTEGFLDKLFSIVQELYVYCHLKDYNMDEDYDQEKQISTFIMCMMIGIFSFTVIKIIAIFLYFLILNLVVSTYRFIKYLIKRRCCVNIFQEMNYTCGYTLRIMKKLYTYNFYSYKNKCFGFFIVTIYLVFISLNISFAAEYLKRDNNKEPLTDTVKILQILSFELSIFVELVCCFFYLTRNSKVQYISTFVSFVVLNGVICGTMFYKEYFCDSDDDNPRRVANLVFLIFFSFLFILCFRKVYKYDLNCEFIILFISRGLEVFVK